MANRGCIVGIGCLVLLLVFIGVDVTYGFFKPETGSYRVGKSVIVKTEENIPEGLFVAGGNVEVLGKVQGELKAFGAHVAIPGTVDGRLIVFGANVVLPGNYHHSVKGGAANVILSGTFDGDVEVIAAKITLTSTAVVKGDFNYSAPVLEQEGGAQIMGKLTRKGLRVREIEVEKFKERWSQIGWKILLSMGVLYGIVSLSSIFVVGLIIRSLLPGPTEAVIKTISQSPWKNLGIGFVFLVVVPAGAILSLVTLVGIPTGIIAGLLYGILLYISRIFMGVWIGRKLLGVIKKSFATAFFWPLLVGVLILFAAGFVPVIGWLFRFVILLISLGAIWTVIWRLIQEGRGKTQKMAIDAV